MTLLVESLSNCGMDLRVVCCFVSSIVDSYQRSLVASKCMAFEMKLLQYEFSCGG